MNIVSIAAAVLIFGLIILIHEFGHFLLAKLNGVGVVEFSIGMGPRLFSFRKGETRYSIKILPFGGSCMMLGEDEDCHDAKAFNNKSVWARISVIAAGPVFNFVLAFVLGVIIIGAVGYDVPLAGDVQPGSPAAEAGLQEGDRITGINGRSFAMYRELIVHLMANPMSGDEPVKLRFERPSADGSGVEKHSEVVVPKYSEADGRYRMGFSYNAEFRRTGTVLETLKYGAYQLRYCIVSTYESIRMLATGRVKPSEAVAGPVRIMDMIGGIVSESDAYGVKAVLVDLANLCLILSASLGIMNLLPIPALDGGRLVFLFLELVRGKPIDQEKEAMVHMAGMVVLMMLMVLVLFNDIHALFMG